MTMVRLASRGMLVNLNNLKSTLQSVAYLVNSLFSLLFSVHQFWLQVKIGLVTLFALTSYSVFEINEPQ
jgi:hypothetical protein